MVDTTSSIPSAHGAAAQSEHEMALHLWEEAVLDEESSPFDADADDQPVLFVQLLDRDLVPLAKVEVTVFGEGIPTTRTFRTEADGTLLVEDCGPGMYDVCYAGMTARVHTLTQHDLDTDGSAYRAMLLPPPVAQTASSSGRQDV